MRTNGRGLILKVFTQATIDEHTDKDDVTGIESYNQNLAEQIEREGKLKWAGTGLGVGTDSNLIFSSQTQQADNIKTIQAAYATHCNGHATRFNDTRKCFIRRDGSD